jgi:hypothetical protein
MATFFEAYDDEFTGLCRDIGARISHASSYEDCADERLKLLSAANSIISQAADLVKQMQIEVRSEEDAGTRRSMNEKVVQYQQTLARLRRDYEETRIAQEHQALVEDPTAGQRARLMSTNERLERGSDRIKYALEVVTETETTALEIAEELNRNREKIEGVHGRVHAVMGLTDQARRVIHGMGKREIQQKILLWLVALIIIGVTGCIIYLMVA